MFVLLLFTDGAETLQIRLSSNAIMNYSAAETVDIDLTARYNVGGVTDQL